MSIAPTVKGKSKIKRSQTGDEKLTYSTTFHYNDIKQSFILHVPVIKYAARYQWDGKIRVNETLQKLKTY
jgi:hypothetical protein